MPRISHAHAPGRRASISMGVGVVGSVLVASAARATPPEPASEQQAHSTAPEDTSQAEAPEPNESATASDPSRGLQLAPGVHLGAYVEAHYTYAFNQPSNAIIAYRGFDNRHNTFTLANAATGVDVDRKRLHGSLWLQWGNTPASYYAAEPEQPLGGAVGESNARLWRVLQEANAGLRTSVANDVVLDVEAGLFLSPIGPEDIRIAGNWNWSRSNLFFGLPFYHTGARVNAIFLEQWTLTAAVYNGWNSVVDNNPEKSLSFSLAHASKHVEASLLYFTGVERDRDFEEGRPWRHLFDTWIVLHATPWLSFAGQLDSGFEAREAGTHTWFAGAGYARITPLRWLELALRGDGFREWAPRGPGGERLDPIFWPSSWVTSGTATLGVRPHEAVLVRLEYRHDHAAGRMYYRSSVATDPTTGFGLPNARAQDTLTLGTVVGF